MIEVLPEIHVHGLVILVVADDLRASLANPASQAFAREQQSDDGSWGACYKYWFWKVAESVDRINDLAHEGKEPRYQTRFLDRIHSPERLTAYLNSILISDLSSIGVNRRKELNEGGTTLVKLILLGYPRNYPFHPKLKSTLIEYLDSKWQNPETRYWGAW